MTRIKICGVTNREDAQAAVAYGADALGFIAVPESPRYVTPEAAREAQVGLPPFTVTVVVARQVVDSVGYSTDAVQFYGGNPNHPMMKRLIRVFRIRDAASLDELREFRHPVSAFLLDTFHEAALGGVGAAFDWSLAVEAQRIAGDIPIILAGGLTPENVGEAVAKVRPYAVDVSSGVEAEPGCKDHDKLRRFIQAVRRADLD
ncbi:MAG: phosphoribosylanthranilate isomerase [Armatimonadaceae bacterium]